MNEALTTMPPTIKDALEQSGVDYSARFSKDGHIKIWVKGRFVGKVSRNKPDGLRGEKNIIAQIRRASI